MNIRRMMKSILIISITIIMLCVSGCGAKGSDEKEKEKVVGGKPPYDTVYGKIICINETASEILVDVESKTRELTDINNQVWIKFNHVYVTYTVSEEDDSSVLDDATYEEGGKEYEKDLKLKLGDKVSVNCWPDKVTCLDGVFYCDGAEVGKIVNNPHIDSEAEDKASKAVWTEIYEFAETKTTWNNIGCNEALENVLNSNTDENVIFAVEVHGGANMIDDFSYIGQSYEELTKIYNELCNKSNALAGFSKGVGEDLALGKEVLCTTGGADGVWSELYYDQVVSNVTQENIDKYIVDGAFLNDLWEKDLSAEQAEIVKISAKINALEMQRYYTDASDTMKQFEKLGITTTVKNYNCYIFVTKEELLSLPKEITDRMFFIAGASREYYYEE